MMQFLEFTFASFYHFAGIVVLLTIVVAGVVETIGALTALITHRPNRYYYQKHDETKRH